MSQARFQKMVHPRQGFQKSSNESIKSQQVRDKKVEGGKEHNKAIDKTFAPLSIFL
jgi:hypothetical protein